MDIQEVGWNGGMEWIYLAEGRDEWLAVVHAISYVWVSSSPGKSTS